MVVVPGGASGSGGGRKARGRDKEERGVIRKKGEMEKTVCGICGRKERERGGLSKEGEKTGEIKVWYK